MKLKYRLFKRKNGYYFFEDRETRVQGSLKTKDATEATRLLNIKNEAHQSGFGLQLAKVCLATADPALAKRTWRSTLEDLIKTKQGENAERWKRVVKDKAFKSILDLPLLKTRPDHFLTVLTAGTVSTNAFLRKLHNFALGFGWLLSPILHPKQWPKVRYKLKRAVTRNEHERIVAREQNPERRAFYELLWELGGAQGDIAKLSAEDIDWQNRGISYFRAKTGKPSRVRFDEEVERILRALPSDGPLFPYLRTVRASDRATEFKQRCRGLGIEGITLHSYRYAWAERARAANYPERLAQEALGHASKAVHRAYARGVNPEHLTIGEWTKRQREQKVIAVQFKEPAGVGPAESTKENSAAAI